MARAGDGALYVVKSRFGPSGGDLIPSLGFDGARNDLTW